MTEPEVPVVRLEARGDREMLRRVHAALARRQGLRRKLSAGRLALEVDAPEIERIGPEIEALATAAGLELRLVDLDAHLAPSLLDGRPSGVWAAIGDAALDLELAHGRDEEAAGGVYGRVSVTEEGGVRIARDGRSPRVEPAVQPPDLSPVKYDDKEYHEEAAIEAGQPAEHGATHIGLFLSWLIRNDLHDPELFDDAHVAAIRQGEMAGSDLAGYVDGKLVSDMLTDEGNGFAAARYDAYLDAYGVVFADQPDYAIEDDPAAEALVHPMIDGIYADWVAAGRPASAPKPTGTGPDLMRWVEPGDHDWDAILEASLEAPGDAAIRLGQDGSVQVDTIEPPHADPALEALIPDDLIDPSSRRMSYASAGGDRLLGRAIKGLGIPVGNVTTATAFGRDVMVRLFRVPGAGAPALREAFRTVIYKPPQTAWSDRVIEGEPVTWNQGIDGPHGFAIAFWARDGLVVHVAGPPNLLPGAIARIRAGL